MKFNLNEFLNLAELFFWWSWSRVSTKVEAYFIEILSTQCLTRITKLCSIYLQAKFDPKSFKQSSLLCNSIRFWCYGQKHPKHRLIYQTRMLGRQFSLVWNKKVTCRVNCYQSGQKLPVWSTNFTILLTCSYLSGQTYLSGQKSDQTGNYWPDR